MAGIKAQFDDVAGNPVQVSHANPLPVTQGTGSDAPDSPSFALNGPSTYSAKPSGTNANATSAYASATSITITGLSFLFTKNDVSNVEQTPTSGDSTFFTDTNDFVVTGTLGSQTITIATGVFIASDTFKVYIEGDKKAYDKTSNAIRVEEVTSTDDVALDYDITNAPTGVASYYFSMDGLKKYSIDFTKIGGADTAKLEIFASNDPDSIADASKVYKNITQYGHGISTQAITAASYTDIDLRTYKTESEAMTTVRIDITIAGGAVDADYALKVKVQ